MVLTMYDAKEPLDKIAKYSKLFIKKIKKIKNHLVVGELVKKK